MFALGLPFAVQLVVKLIDQFYGDNHDSTDV